MSHLVFQTHTVLLHHRIYLSHIVLFFKQRSGFLKRPNLYPCSSVYPPERGCLDSVTIPGAKRLVGVGNT